MAVRSGRHHAATTVAVGVKAPAPARSGPARSWRSEALAWLMLGLLLLVALPLFLRMPLWLDVSYYGVCARDILHGGVLERDLNVFGKPPMMPWLLAGVQWLLGWHAPVLRLLDFALVSGSIWLLVHWPSHWRRRAVRVSAAIVLYAFYFSTTEFSHCQPDMWMLFPALGALHLRRRQVAVSVQGRVDLKKAWGRAVLEGLCWGAACLFKPFAALPGGICWLVATLRIKAAVPGAKRRIVMDTFGLLTGGLLAGAAWVIWLIFGQGWSSFWNDVRVWGPGYYSHSPTYTERSLSLLQQFPPWTWIQVASVPLALFAVFRSLAAAVQPRREAVDRITSDALLGGFYLGWFIEANFIQWQFDYHVAPVYLVALTLVMSQKWFSVLPARIGEHRGIFVQTPVAWALLLGMLGVVAARHPLCDPGRLALWFRCWSGRGSAELREALTLETREYPPKWTDLARVANFLRRQQVKDRELTCYGEHTIHLYLNLDIAPASRLILPGALELLYPDKQDLIRNEVRASPNRYVVTDLREIDYFTTPVTVTEPGDPLALPADFPKELATQFPWSEKIVFRAGSFLVHQVGPSPGD